MARAGGGGRPTTTGLLLTACLGLGALIYFELEGQTSLSGVAQSMPASRGGAGNGAGARGAPDGAMAAAAAVPPAETRFEMPPLAVFSEIAARPVFAPTRRPPPPPEEEPAAEAPPPERNQFMLRGVAIAGNQRVVLFERRATGELVRVMEGQSIDGWRVAGIAPGEAMLEAANGDSYVIRVEKDVGGPAPPPVEPRAERARRRAAAAAAGQRLAPHADAEEVQFDEALDPDVEGLIGEEEFEELDPGTDPAAMGRQGG